MQHDKQQPEHSPIHDEKRMRRRRHVDVGIGQRCELLDACDDECETPPCDVGDRTCECGHNERRDSEQRARCHHDAHERHNDHVGNDGVGCKRIEIERLQRPQRDLDCATRAHELNHEARQPTAFA